MASITSSPVINNDLLDDITYGTKWSDSVLQYGFPTASIIDFDADFEATFQSGFGNATIDSSYFFEKVTTRAFSRIDSVITTDFVKTTDSAAIDLLLVSTNDKPKGKTEGISELPGDADRDDTSEYWAFTAFNSGMPTMKAKAEVGGGEYASWTVLHEIGHSLGLLHTHQEVNGTPPLASVGKFLDNERYSVMSYNAASDGFKYGHAITMMALDVAALQALYGAETYADGDNSEYTLLNANTVGSPLGIEEGDVQIGRAYFCVWDSGGSNDMIDYAGGKKSVLINLNDATLDTSGNSADLVDLFGQLRDTEFFKNMSKDLKAGIVDEWHNAGGFFSQVLDFKKNHFVGTDGGFSIANGAVIEDATGGNGVDMLIGNEQGNSITGLGGEDTILGAGGSDWLNGGKGMDWLDGGTGDDFLTGGSSPDVFVFSDGYGTDTIMDFEKADVINLQGLTGVGSKQDLFDNHMVQDGDDVVIEIGTDILVIQDTSVGDLVAKNFEL
jgi:Ca2+-binding RTX toxin-like protein